MLDGRKSAERWTLTLVVEKLSLPQSSMRMDSLSRIHWFYSRLLQTHKVLPPAAVELRSATPRTVSLIGKSLTGSLHCIRSVRPNQSFFCYSCLPLFHCFLLS